MSLFPCDTCLHTVRGPLGAAYPSVIVGGTRFSRKLRLCQPDLGTFLATPQLALHLVEEGEPLEPEWACGFCHSTIDANSRLSPIFVTAYRPHSEREDYYGSLCSECAAWVIKELSLSSR